MDARARKYTIDYVYAVKDHLRVLKKSARKLILDEIEIQLSDEPQKETRRRKPLSRLTVVGDWELRCGPYNEYRVFYTVNAQERLVTILAIGKKEGSRLRIGKEVFDL